MIQIWLNSNSITIKSNSTLADLIKSQGYEDSKVAAEVDMQIIPRANWSDFTIKDGMKIEIVEFVGGG
ncbi:MULTISPECIES: sulfur carrier protein ThiS [Campylobacter]|uniref:Sulfur carrier protein ThiS n=1 Tax=Campylobacter vicugnae TaxID=1660076 RepID=A0A1X9T2U7_9BACT|nr:MULTISPECIES: sulfur carrier protein ThiS [unclassified Campylobacter]MCR8689616.1 sulfur carrier protein ThiS [Campylobacter sp. RM9264]MCR8700941.1 sulfur carrier protein ThiS [Campylobacter sp. RM12176]ARR02791.1 thiamin biosynthesis protein [Campylobacter sp. RM8964]ARR04347.1 thiamin biosynthesis protein [Campylobacter sp. RM12175]MBO5063339.1 sulfur carrier protein ThiS [Campylobacter sp.]